MIGFSVFCVFPGSSPLPGKQVWNTTSLTCSSSRVIGLVALKSSLFGLLLPDCCRSSVVMLGSLQLCFLSLEFCFYLSHFCLVFFCSCSSWFTAALFSLICLHSNICHCKHERVLQETLNTTTCSDIGPQYDCREFHKFARQYELEYITSSHFHQKYNGQEKRSKKAVDSKVQPLPYLT